MGTTNLDSLSLGGNLTVTGTETITGAVTYAGGVTLGDAAGDAITVTGTMSTTTPVTVTSANASALTVGRQGATAPVLKVDSATASQATGISITGAAAAGGVAVAAISSGTDEALTINAKGTGTIGIGSVSTGAVTITPATTITGNATLSGTLAVTGTSALTGAVNYKRQVTDTGGVFATPIALTAAQSGRVILLDDAAGLDFTLPAIGADEVGTHYKFLLTVEPTSNSYRITAQTGDVLNGHVVIFDKDVAEGSTEALLQVFQANGSSHLVTTITGTDDTQGSLIGGWLEFTAISATGWFVQGSLIGDGSLATIFS